MSRLVQCILFLSMPGIGFSQIPDSVNLASSVSAFDTARVHWLLQMAEQMLDENPDQAHRLIEEAVQVATKHHMISAMAEAELLTGDYLKRNSQCEKALERYERARMLFVQAGEEQAAMQSINRMAACNIDLGHLDEALRQVNWALGLGHLHNNKAVIGRSLTLKAIIYRQRGEVEFALQHFLEALQIAELLQETKLLSTIYSNLGALFLDADDLNNARKYLMLAAHYRQQENDRNGLAKVYSSLGVLFRRQDSLQQAQEYYLKALGLFRELSNRGGMALALQNLGVIYRSLNQPHVALNHHEQALAIRKELGDRRGAAVGHYNIALTYLDVRNAEQALHHLHESERLARQMDMRDLLALIPEARAEAQALAGNQKAAIEELRTALQHRDSLYNLDRLRQFDELHAKYETEKKDKELLQQRLELEKKNAQLHRQRLTNYLLYGGLSAFVLIAGLTVAMLRQRQKLERERAVEQTRRSIARDLHDDIGATLSTVTIFSSLALKKLESDASAVSQLLQRIRTVSEKMMSDMSDVIWLIKPENDSSEKLSERIRALAHQLLTPAQIEYQLDLEAADSRLPMKARRNIYLIIKEGLANVAKHSQARNVQVLLKEQSGKLLLRIVDNGKGLNGASATGSRYLGGNGLGHMKQRAEQLGGILHARGNEPSGTIIEAVFDLSAIGT
ncbi:MAG: tetratricopeptide repeat protein [Chitinophagales bacterium]|nr:tetratricopeptide repeat protein [Chitinophagales bacterium]MDW8427377.1 tetratricopeptide repeat protein [Chitinophagales bacterium]